MSEIIQKNKLWTKLLTKVLLFTLVSGLYACNIPYKIDIEQGSNITAQEFSKVSIGMSKDEVKLILGTPLLKDTFNENRWDYVQYYISAKKKERKQNIVSLYFSNELLVNIKGQVIEIEKDKVEY